MVKNIERFRRNKTMKSDLEQSLDELPANRRIVAAFMDLPLTKHEITFGETGVKTTSIIYKFDSDERWLFPACRKYCTNNSIKFNTMEWSYSIKIENTIRKYLYSEAELIDIFNALVEGIRWRNENKK